MNVKLIGSCLILTSTYIALGENPEKDTSKGVVSVRKNAENSSPATEQPKEKSHDSKWGFDPRRWIPDVTVEDVKGLKEKAVTYWSNLSEKVKKPPFCKTLKSYIETLESEADPILYKIAKSKVDALLKKYPEDGDCKIPDDVRTIILAADQNLMDVYIGARSLIGLGHSDKLFKYLIELKVHKREIFDLGVKDKTIVLIKMGSPAEPVTELLKPKSK